MTTDLTTTTSTFAPAVVEAKKQYAQALAASGLLPDAYVRNPANVLVAVEYGEALGLKPMQAITGINVIKGRPALSAQMMSSLVRQAGHKLRVKETSPTSVTATLIRKDDPDAPFVVVWDREKAQAAGLWGQRGPWTSYPAQMLANRAISEVCRKGAAECLSGLVYTPEEVENLGAAPGVSGEDGSALSVPPAEVSQPAPEPDGRERVTAFIADLLTQAGCETSTAPVIYEMAAEAGVTGSPDAVRAWMHQAKDAGILPLTYTAETVEETTGQGVQDEIVIDGEEAQA